MKVKSFAYYKVDGATSVVYSTGDGFEFIEMLNPGATDLEGADFTASLTLFKAKSVIYNTALYSNSNKCFFCSLIYLYSSSKPINGNHLPFLFHSRFSQVFSFLFLFLVHSVSISVPFPFFCIRTQMLLLSKP